MLQSVPSLVFSSTQMRSFEINRISQVKNNELLFLMLPMVDSSVNMPRNVKDWSFVMVKVVKRPIKQLVQRRGFEPLPLFPGLVPEPTSQVAPAREDGGREDGPPRLSARRTLPGSRPSRISASAGM